VEPEPSALRALLFRLFTTLAGAGAGNVSMEFLDLPRFLAEAGAGVAFWPMICRMRPSFCSSESGQPSTQRVTHSVRRKSRAVPGFGEGMTRLAVAKLTLTLGADRRHLRRRAGILPHGLFDAQ